MGASAGVKKEKTACRLCVGVRVMSVSRVCWRLEVVVVPDVVVVVVDVVVESAGK